MYNSDLPTREELPSTSQLIRSTVIAAAVATVLLITTVLPAEFGIDPTGVGKLLGLKQMGEIKVSLEQEAQAEKTAVKPQPAPSQPAQTIKAVQTFTSPTVAETPTSDTAVKVVAAATVVKEEPQLVKIAAQQAPPTSPVTSHQKVFKLQHGEAAEIKLEMVKGAKVNYQWSTQGGAVNFDTHGDSATLNYFGYSKGRKVKGDKGELIAAFDGSHGWFWRNRSGNTVTVTLTTEGDYQSIERKL